MELERHSVLFSEGLPTESYLDTGNRAFFQNGGDVIDLNAGFAGVSPSVAWECKACAPLVHDAGSVWPVWERLAARAAAIGYAALETETTLDPAPRLAVEGKEFRPVRTAGDRYSFMLPSRPAEVRLLTRSARPSDTRPWVDEHRVLGVAVSRVRIHQGSDIHDLALDGPACGRGWWDVEHRERSMWRWTNGDAVLRLPEAHGSSRVLEITMGGEMTYPLEATDLSQGLKPIVRIA